MAAARFSDVPLALRPRRAFELAFDFGPREWLAVVAVGCGFFNPLGAHELYPRRAPEHRERRHLRHHSGQLLIHER